AKNRAKEMRESRRNTHGISGPRELRKHSSTTVLPEPSSPTREIRPIRASTDHSKPLRAASWWLLRKKNAGSDFEAKGSVRNPKNALYTWLIASCGRNLTARICSRD